MVISREIKQLKQERKKMEKELLKVIKHMAHLTTSRVYRRCGNPKCKRCRKEGGKHGPFFNVAYKEGGKTRGFYVPVGFEDYVEGAQKEWKEFKTIGYRIGAINRKILQIELKEGGMKRQNKKTKGKAKEGRK